MKLLFLRIVLLVIGLLSCLTGILLLLPADQIAGIAGWFVGSETVDELWPSGPVFDYVLRQALGGAIWIGVILLVTATNPTKYRGLVDVAIGGMFLIGIVSLVAGLQNELPTHWFMLDVVVYFVVGVVLLLLRPGKPTQE